MTQTESYPVQNWSLTIPQEMLSTTQAPVLDKNLWAHMCMSFYPVLARSWGDNDYPPPKNLQN